MSTSSVQVERRASQRFPFQIPLGLKITSDGRQDCGLTQDISARGVLFYTDLNIPEGAGLELTLVMPAEITLAETARVRCQGKCLRVSGPGLGNKYAVAAQIKHYEFLAETAKKAVLPGRETVTADKIAEPLSSALPTHGSE